MTQQFDIPFALANHWDELLKTKGKCFTYYEIAKWASDQELDACRKALDKINPDKYWSQRLLESRRPKPLTLKEQSLALLDLIQEGKKAWQLEDLNVIRRVLKNVPDNE